ncbi:MAG: DNA repair protein RecO [Lachnospiraceae bacterium]|nr:DNA repair protein RecO [Lachnospiraceae bacterium]MBO4462306.1 DNA repair protein RecO [Lachnospiraceae bacterium]MBR4795948.1 DNA repair protein RecO [Lachnospiraceae bacterium]MBR5789786.1 DNA repair protein RecO [Lachnospiraceae bacterium]
MSERITATGMVLMSTPVGDYDKRIVLLTRDMGRITCFARGARRQNSALLAGTNPFAFGEFEMFVGRDSYTIVKANIKEYFRELTIDPDLASYGFYFLEIANYYTRENLDGSDMLKLIYVSIKALLSEKLDFILVRRIFELKAMQLNGEYPVIKDDEPYLEATKYAFKYVTSSKIERLFTFTVLPDVLEEMGDIIDSFMDKHIDRKFNSLSLLHLQIDQDNV